MGMRDWLIIIVIVGIILILLDGYRRKRKDSIRVKLEKNIPPLDAESEAAAELPNGGARIIPREDNFDDEEYSEDDYQEYGDEQDDDDQVVPVLMDAVNIDKELTIKDLPVNSEEAEESSNEAEDDEDDEGEREDDFDDDNAEVGHVNEHVQEEQDEDEDEDEELSEDYDESDTYGDEELNDDEELSSVRVSQREEEILASKSNISTASQDRIEPTLGKMEAFSEAELDDRPASATQAKNKKRKKNQTDSNKAAASLQAELFSESPGDFIQADEEHDENDEGFLEPEEVIVINVMAKKGELFAGSDLLPILMQHDMRLGRMSIFHKHEDSRDDGPVVFSMANMVKPGTFDVTQMEEFSTPGVSFFLQLPNAFGNMKSFEQMLNAADSIKESLNGDLKDEHRSVITRQTIEHCRQRIQDFELAQLSKK